MESQTSQMRLDSKRGRARRSRSPLPTHLPAQHLARANLSALRGTHAPRKKGFTTEATQWVLQPLIGWPTSRDSHPGLLPQREWVDPGSLRTVLERSDWPEFLASLCLIFVCLATLCLIPRDPSIRAHLKRRAYGGLNRPYLARLCLKQHCCVVVVKNKA